MLQKPETSYRQQRSDRSRLDPNNQMHDRASDYLDPGGSYHSFVDDMMSQAFGAPLIRSDGTNCENI